MNSDADVSKEARRRDSDSKSLRSSDEGRVAISSSLPLQCLKLGKGWDNKEREKMRALRK